MRAVVFALAVCLPLFSCVMAHDTAGAGRTVDCPAAIAATAFGIMQVRTI
ncbi:MAG: hypothetical protein HDR32_10845 [Treponema sp.]|nr:hypothetical protein [Treponema sp.]